MEADQTQSEAALRAVIERLLRGGLSPGGKRDPKTLVPLAGVARIGFYAKKHPDGSVRPGAYQYLAAEFERCRAAALHARP